MRVCWKALVMPTIVPPSVSLVDAARGARALGRDRASGPDGGSAQPTAAGAFGPAVVNHVRGADKAGAGADAAGPAAEGGGSAPDKAGKTSTSEPKDTTKDKAKDKQLRELAKRDSDVRAHEQAHAAAGGQYAGAPSYSFQRGPDGRDYAVGGEVPIDVSPISGDPDATIQKMQQVKRAALAPIDPSDADRAIASHADAQIAQAQQDKLAGKKQPDKGEDSSAAAEAGSAARDVFGALMRRSGAAGYGAANGVGQTDQVA